jgi:flagellar protein FliJ
MRRSDRLREVQRSMEQERTAVQQRLALKSRSVSAALERLQELLRYREDYVQRYRSDVSAGLPAIRLRNYQTFLARVDQALKQQHDLLARARAEAEFEANKLSDISGQIVAVGGVADRWASDENRLSERREQNSSDEFAQRMHAAAQSIRRTT